LADAAFATVVLGGERCAQLRVVDLSATASASREVCDAHAEASPARLREVSRSAAAIPVQGSRESNIERRARGDFSRRSTLVSTFGERLRRTHRCRRDVPAVTARPRQSCSVMKASRAPMRSLGAK
jgi:hypothetical protein